MNYIDYIPSLQWLSAIITSALIIYLYPFRKNEVALSFSIFLLFNVVWSLTSALIFEVDDLNTKIFFNRLKISGIFYLIFSLLWFALSLKGSFWKNKKYFFLIALYPTVMMIITFSPWHEMVITDYKLEEFHGRNIMTFQNGTIFSLHLFIARLYFISAVYIIYKSLSRNFAITKRNSLLLISLLIIPGFTDLIGVYFIPYFRYLNLVPVTFLLTSTALSYIIIRHGFLKLIPKANEQLLRNMNTPLIIWDMQHRIVDLNNSAREKFQFQLQEFNNDIKLEALIPDVNEFSLNDKIYQVEHTQVENDQKNGIGGYTLLVDITKLKQSQQELEENNNLINNLMNVLSHDIHGHIAQLGFLTDILKFDFDKLPSSEKEEIKQAIFGLSKELNSYMGDIVNWSREQKGKIQLNARSFNLYESINGIINFLNTLSQNKNISMTNYIPKDKFIKTDPTILEIIIRNLVWNAIKHSKQNRKINISYHDQNIIIENVASFIDIKAFNDFFNDAYSLPSMQGLGVGLKICKFFAKKIHLQIFYEQKNELVRVKIKLNEFNNG